MRQPILRRFSLVLSSPSCGARTGVNGAADPAGASGGGGGGADVGPEVPAQCLCPGALGGGALFGMARFRDRLAILGLRAAAQA